MEHYSESELIINEDGSIFHLHLMPEDVAHKVILVGDPERVDMIGSLFDTQRVCKSNREFKSITGCYKGKEITVLSTGIGCDNIDIVLTELDALVNIDFQKRTNKNAHTTLEIIRIGTCGGLQPYTPTGTFICSEKSIGFEGLINFYEGRDQICDLDFEQAFTKAIGWSPFFCAPYVVDNDKELLDRINHGEMVKGVTISTGGFYGPQGRKIRIPLADPQLNRKIVEFNYQNRTITNFEMESAAVAGLARLLGHKAMTVCMVVANRYQLNAETHYHHSIKKLIETVLERF